MDIAQIEQIKIQAKVLVPLIKALRAELGTSAPTSSCASLSETTIARPASDGGVSGKDPTWERGWSRPSSGSRVATHSTTKC